ncbi:unnamed protein product, partial [Dovyalis caffra]
MGVHADHDARKIYCGLQRRGTTDERQRAKTPHICVRGSRHTVQPTPCPFANLTNDPVSRTILAQKKEIAWPPERRINSKTTTFNGCFLTKPIRISPVNGMKPKKYDLTLY